MNVALADDVTHGRCYARPMPSFLNRRERYLLTTSYKVMYSTLTRQPELVELSPRSPSPFRLFFDRRLRHYMLARDPYARLLSFYFNKLAIAEENLALARRWQHCQRVFFPSLGLTGSEDGASIGDRLRGISFERFVTLLDEVAWKDDHLLPQVESRRRRLRGTRLCVTLPLDRVLRMETDIGLLASELGLDVRVRENRSEGPADVSLFTPAALTVVNRIYDRDFAELGYRKR
jgi:hypothetical protein